jgi:phosphoribosylaminoimidazole-succinocarboxamide synthase
MTGKEKSFLGDGKMVEEEILKKQLSLTLKETDFQELGKPIMGKVRDTYDLGEKRILITTDRLSAFDRVLTTIPFKGQVLNQISAFWFEKTLDIVKNHVIEVPDPNVTIARTCEVVPVEMVVRGYLTGSAWRDYEAGKDISGIELPKGMKQHQRFEKPIVTPSTKAEQGDHDEPISKEGIIEKGVVEEKLYNQLEKLTLALYERGVQISAKQGLILVDTKYEFGLVDGEVYLIDEIHTPDSSRYWYIDSYEERFNAGKEPQILDKEYVRQWLIKEKNYMGDGPQPEIPDDVRLETARRYIRAFETITGKQLNGQNNNPAERIKESLKQKGYL